MNSLRHLEEDRAETKGRFRERAVLANVPSFLFLVPGNICENHPLGNHPFANPPKRDYLPALELVKQFEHSLSGMQLSSLLTVGSFLLTVDFFAYSCAWELLSLELELFYLQLELLFFKL